jgi:hypothetical protein
VRHLHRPARSGGRRRTWSCRRAAWLAAAGCTLGTACTEELSGRTGPSTLRIDIQSPSQRGSETEPLPDEARSIALTVQALDAAAAPAPVDTDVALYLQYLGSLSPRPGSEPAMWIRLRNGAGAATLRLSQVYGPTVLWVEDSHGDAPSYATGTSDPLWFRDPHLEDLSRPAPGRGEEALFRSPLEGKQVRVSRSRHGAAGALVVTGVSAQGYTVSDVRCDSRPCTTSPYGHMYVFSFSRPVAVDRRPVRVGHRLAWVAGAVTEFNGLTELGYPQTELQPGPPDPDLLPAPARLDAGWLQATAGGDRGAALEPLESALVSLEGGVICPVDGEYDKYGQWKIDVGHGCRRSYSVISRDAVPDLDPTALEGRQVRRIVGVLRAVNLPNMDVWIIEPRGPEDIELADATPPPEPPAH